MVGGEAIMGEYFDVTSIVFYLILMFFFWGAARENAGMSDGIKRWDRRGKLHVRLSSLRTFLLYLAFEAFGSAAHSYVVRAAGDCIFS